MKKIRLTLDIETANKLLRFLDISSRIGMLQFKYMIELLAPKLSCDKKQEIENYLKQAIAIANDDMLFENSYYSMSSDKVPEGCRLACDIYQYLRREISWNETGKDYRVDKRDWNSMLEVYFDDPLRFTNANIETEIIDE